MHNKSEVKKPKVSVIIPLYNRKKHIYSCIQSILNQSFKDYELIVLDDGSTDGSDEIVSSFKESVVHLFKNDVNKGISYTRNRLNNLASGEYIAVLDSDDLAEPDRLEKQVAYLDKHPDIDLVAGCAQLIDEEGTALGEIWGAALRPENVYAFLPLGNQIIHSTVMGRRQFFLEFPFNEQLRTAEDYDVWLRGNNTCKYAVTADVVASYRVHDQSISRKEDQGINRNAYMVKYQYLEHIIGAEYPEHIVLNAFENLPSPLINLNTAHDIILKLYNSSPQRIFEIEKEWKNTFSALWHQCLYRVKYFKPTYIRFMFSPLSASIPFMEKIKYMMKCLSFRKNYLVHS